MDISGVTYVALYMYHTAHLKELSPNKEHPIVFSIVHYSIASQTVHAECLINYETILVQYLPTTPRICNRIISNVKICIYRTIIRRT